MKAERRSHAHPAANVGPSPAMSASRIDGRRPGHLVHTSATNDVEEDPAFTAEDPLGQITPSRTAVLLLLGVPLTFALYVVLRGPIASPTHDFANTASAVLTAGSLVAVYGWLAPRIVLRRRPLRPRTFDLPTMDLWALARSAVYTLLGSGALTALVLAFARRVPLGAGAWLAYGLGLPGLGAMVGSTGAIASAELLIVYVAWRTWLRRDGRPRKPDLFAAAALWYAAPYLADDWEPQTQDERRRQARRRLELAADLVARGAPGSAIKRERQLLAGAIRTITVAVYNTGDRVRAPVHRAIREVAPLVARGDVIGAHCLLHAAAEATGTLTRLRELPQPSTERPRGLWPLAGVAAAVASVAFVTWRLLPATNVAPYLASALRTVATKVMPFVLGLVGAAAGAYVTALGKRVKRSHRLAGEVLSSVGGYVAHASGAKVGDSEETEAETPEPATL